MLLGSLVTNLSYDPQVGFTPLITAIQHGHYKVVEELISAGVNIIPNNDFSVLHCAVSHYMGALSDEIKEAIQDIIALLIENGADRDFRMPPYNKTAFDFLNKFNPWVIKENELLADLLRPTSNISKTLSLP